MTDQQYEDLQTRWIDAENAAESDLDAAHDNGYTEAVEYLDNEVCPSEITDVYGVLATKMREFRIKHGYSFRVALSIYDKTEDEAYDIGFLDGVCDYASERFDQ